MIGLECTCARQRRICAPARDVEASEQLRYVLFSFQLSSRPHFPRAYPAGGFCPGDLGLMVYNVRIPALET
jgi:hypothetical protein